MSPGLPRMLGVVPRLGRSFARGEEERGAPRVVMLSEALWQRRFGGDPRVLGRDVTLEGDPYTVIGIIPATGQRAMLPSHLATAQRVDLWLPLRLNTDVAPRGLHFMDVVGRLRPELSFQQAEERLEVFARRLRESKVTEHGIRISALERGVIGDSRPLLVALAGAAGMVLLIACTNVANLLLARASGRRREVAILAALGAGRGRIVRQLLVESLLLALLGAAAGALVAHLGVLGLRAVGPTSVPRLAEAAVDARLLIFALGLSMFTGLLFGLVPALQTSRPDLAEVIKVGGRGAVGGPARDRFRVALVVTEVALSFALLIGAGLLAQSLGRLLAVEKGFESERVVSAYLNLPGGRYPEAHQQIAFFRELRERLEALPGVRSAALVNNPPLTGGPSGGFAIEGRTFPPEGSPFAWKRIVSPDYFATLGIPIVAGRAIDERDVAGAAPVLVVNQAFARRYFPGENPLGKRVDFSWETTGFQEIVGVAKDAREQALDRPAEPILYIPLAQRAETGMYLLVRTVGATAGIIPQVRKAVAALDRDRALSEVQTLEDVLSQTLARRRLAMALFGAFSALALFLAAVGLYAVISYSVQQRKKEIGIRLALGARESQVAGTVIRRGIVLIAAGTVLGALAALGLGRFLAALVFGVGTADPMTYAGVAGLLVGTALVASLVPALRAARVDPSKVLSGE
jgi:predicted permease